MMVWQQYVVHGDAAVGHFKLSFLDELLQEFFLVWCYPIPEHLQETHVVEHVLAARLVESLQHRV